MDGAADTPLCKLRLERAGITGVPDLCPLPVPPPPLPDGRGGLRSGHDITRVLPFFRRLLRAGSCLDAAAGLRWDDIAMKQDSTMEFHRTKRLPPYVFEEINRT